MTDRATREPVGRDPVAYPPLVRRSPITLPGTPLRAVDRDGWRVALEIEHEGPGPWIVDLSHRSRWDYQDRRIDDARPFDLSVPPRPGDVGIGGGLMIHRMNGTQAAIWHVGPGDPPAVPPVVSLTDTTDSNAWIAILGGATPAVLERVTSLDLFPPGRSEPRLTQGPVLGVPCQIVAWAADLALLALSRGYAQPLVDALLDAAADLELRPAGERRFTDRWAEVSGRGASSADEG